MRLRQQAVAIGVAAAILAMWTNTAQATCNINSAGISATPLTANTGTYTAPTTPPTVTITFTISGTYTTNAAAGTCDAAIFFQRSTMPASMANIAGGGTTLPYTIQSSAGTLIFVATATNVNVAEYRFAGVASVTNRAFSGTVTADFVMQPAVSQAGGSYSDAITLAILNVNIAANTGQFIGTRGFTVTGTVAKSCTVGGVAHATDTATIPISAAGAVNTAVINRSYSSVACNAPSNVQLTSQNGAIKTTGTGPAAFTNLIDYSAAATFSGATASLNTATNPLATGPESGTAVSTTGTQPNGTMTVTITPQANVKTLIGGTYSDTLTITITPQ